MVVEVEVQAVNKPIVAQCTASAIFEVTENRYLIYPLEQPLTAG